MKVTANVLSTVGNWYDFIISKLDLSAKIF